MSFNIPGYFLDKKTNKLFKITPHGPYSLSELRKRVQQEEEEEAAAALAPKLTTSQIPQPTNINQFLKKRASLASPRTDSAMHYIMSHFKPRSCIQLDDSVQKYNNMLVETTQADEYGEMFISSRLGLEHFGYELDPQFHMWKTDGQRHNKLNTLSMQLLPKLVEHEDQVFRVLAGTSGGTLWSHQFQQLPPLISDEIKHMFTEQDTIMQRNNVLPTPVYSYSGYCNSRNGRKFEQKKDMFWSFSVNDCNDSVVVGGDQKIYHLNSQFRMQSCRKVKSSVFATHIPATQPYVCWSGSRNGKISLLDWRQDKFSHEYLTHKYTQSSSITNIRTLKNGFELLTVGLDGSINIWDTRRKRQDQFSLKGHVNEINQSLGFDIDLENELVMATGSDGYVRIWSYANQCNDGKPIWTSRKYNSPIPACKFKTTASKYPRFQEGWDSVLDVPARQCPGILIFGTSETNTEAASIEWQTSLK